MFDSMKSALKNHLMRAKAQKPQLGDEYDKDKSPDKAPVVHAPGGDAQQPMIAESPEHEANEENLQHQILQAISGLGGHGGRGAMGLNERAADKAKEKYASIQKHKGDLKV